MKMSDITKCSGGGEARVSSDIDTDMNLYAMPGAHLGGIEWQKYFAERVVLLMIFRWNVNRIIISLKMCDWRYLIYPRHVIDRDVHLDQSNASDLGQSFWKRPAHVYIWAVCSKGATIRFPGGWGRSIFEINNFGRTLREINNLLQELFHINM